MNFYLFFLVCSPFGCLGALRQKQEYDARPDRPTLTNWGAPHGVEGDDTRGVTKLTSLEMVEMPMYHLGVAPSQ